MNVNYLDTSKLPYPFCPGCSHGKILNLINEALTLLKLPPHKVVIVTDIGCVGLSDQYFHTHAFHGLHGRSVCYAEGIHLVNPELKVIVLMGDGGAGIGGHHLLNAARRNMDITVVLFNNMNFGMTGGEHSVTTPPDFTTSTTWSGQFETPFRIAETLKLNGATFVARRAFYDKDLAEILAEALNHEGFSYVEVMEYCTAYLVAKNKIRKKELEHLLTHGPFPRLTHQRTDVPTYRSAYTQHFNAISRTGQNHQLIHPEFHHSLEKPLTFLFAGSAGMKIQSSAHLLARAFLYSGGYASIVSDYPVTVKTGYSLAFVQLSPEPIHSIGFQVPHVLLLISTDGLHKARRYIPRMTPGSTIVTTLQDEFSIEREDLRILPFVLQNICPKPSREMQAFATILWYLRKHPIFPLEAFEKAIHMSFRTQLAQKYLHIYRAILQS